MKKIARILVVTLVLISGFILSVVAQPATSWNTTFKYGMGTTLDSKTMHALFIPCHTTVTATVEISGTYRIGLDKNDPHPSTRTTIQLISPRENLSDPKSVATYNSTVVADGIKKTITLNGAPSSNGCSVHNSADVWAVVVKPASGSEDLSDYSVSGKITIRYAPTVKTYVLADTAEINLGQGNWVEKSIAGEHFDWGQIEITVEVYYPTSAEGPVKLKVELVNAETGASLVGYDSGYPLNEPRSNTVAGVTSSPKIKYIIDVGGMDGTHFSGGTERNIANYKLRITNIGSGQEALRVKPIIKLTTRCL